MKTPSDDIFQLIQAMTAAEKRYFKIHFSSEKSLITELFNLLNSMKSYNEDEVKKHFKNSKLSKNLKVYKIMLSELLLKSLSSFRYKKSINSLIRQSLEEVEIFAEKRLYSQAIKKLHKTKQLCYEHEKFNQLITIINLEYGFQDFYEIPASSSDSLSLFNELIQTNNLVSEILVLKKLEHELKNNAGLQLSKKASNSETKLIEANLNKNIKNNKTFQVQYHSLSSLAHLAQINRNFKKELPFREQAVDLFKTKPSFIESNPQKYWTANFQLASSYLLLDEYDKYDNAIQYLKTLIKKNPSFKRKNILISTLELARHRRQKNFSIIIDEIEPEILNQIELYELGEERSFTFAYISLMMTYLSLENHPKVQFYLRRLFKSSIESDTFNYFFEIVNMISHYESGDLDILQNLLTSKKRKIKRNSSYGTPFYKEILNFFSQLLDPKNDRKKSIKELQSKVKLYPEDNFVGLIHHFIFDDWMKALVANKTYGEYVNQ